MILAEDFYEELRAEPRQGDILLTGVSRIIADDRFVPQSWKPLDQHYVTIDAGDSGRDIHAAMGVGLAMLITHDCQIDKEWNRRVQQLTKKGRSPVEAEREAEADSSLDRSLSVCPLVDPNEIDVDRGVLMAGKTIGYFPVPAYSDDLVPEAIVDLTYRCTTDRLGVLKVASISNAARARLRYALMQLDALRAAELGFEVEAVTGKRINRVEIPRNQPMLVRVHLDDGNVLELLQQPTEPPDGSGRTGASLSPSTSD